MRVKLWLEAILEPNTEGNILQSVVKFNPLVLAASSRLRNATNSSFLCILFSVERLMITLASE